MLLSAALIALWSSPAGQEVVADPGGPVAIVGGDEALACEFPSVAALLGVDDELRCSSTLVHPRVVVTAAHCITQELEVIAVGFGEGANFEEQVPGLAPERIVPVEHCEPHPSYVADGYPDIAYCTLSEAVDDVPTVPLLTGCELDALQPDVEVTIVGFGATFGEPIKGPGGEPDVDTVGTGPKRYTTQTIDFVERPFAAAYLVGPNGSQSACFGDSGGPAMIEMEDGTWRVFGAGSQLYFPDDAQPPEIPGNICGAGVSYALYGDELDWLQTDSGYDLTPCHDDDEQWSPGDGCGDFPMSPGIAAGSWAKGCAGGPVGGGEPLCGDVGGTGTTGEGETGDSMGDSSATSTDGSSTSDDGGPGGVTTDSPESSDGDSSAPGGTGIGMGTGSSSGDETAGSDDLGDGGCACRPVSRPGPWNVGAWLLGVMLASLRRRGRRRPA